MAFDSPTVDLSRPALFDPGRKREWSHAELRATAVGLASRIADAGSGLAFLLSRNTFDAVVAYLACLEAGVAVVLLDSRTRPPDLQRLLEIYRPELVLAVDETSPGAGYRLEGPVDDLRLWWREPGDVAAPVHPDLSVLLSTSGSTGSPKLVRLTRRAVEANAGSIATALGLDPDERAMASLPLYYSYGLSVLNSHLHAGASVVLTDETVVSPHFWRLFRSQRCTSMPGVPYTYDLLLRIGFESLELPSLRALTQAGGRLAPDLVRRFHAEMARRGGRFHVMYGQTEATARIACLPPDRLPGKVGTVGVAIPGGRLSVDVGGGREGAPSEVGEIVYTGPNVMMGYAESRADLARGDELGGVLRTGDLGFLDEDGFLHVTGRSKRIGKVLGMRVSLDEVEARLRARGPTAVVAGDDQLLVFCEYGDEALFSALGKELARDLRATENSFVFRRIPALPLTASGKPDYQKLVPP
jgi:acyl-CoA synthetase (AMP-forming)/AMP-acid ligase II